ncbi:uncharacterized protein [Panulirus ornatus]|uniref:uncharacterized protein n=1 Tax=Panulirus ornatus TaxID=150431 RepID=UPI003A887A3B
MDERFSGDVASSSQTRKVRTKFAVCSAACVIMSIVSSFLQAYLASLFFGGVAAVSFLLSFKAQTNHESNLNTTTSNATNHQGPYFPPHNTTQPPGLQQLDVSGLGFSASATGHQQNDPREPPPPYSEIHNSTPVPVRNDISSHLYGTFPPRSDEGGAAVMEQPSANELPSYEAAVATRLPH